MVQRAIGLKLLSFSFHSSLCFGLILLNHINPTYCSTKLLPFHSLFFFFFGLNRFALQQLLEVLEVCHAAGISFWQTFAAHDGTFWLTRGKDERRDAGRWEDLAFCKGTHARCYIKYGLCTEWHYTAGTHLPYFMSASKTTVAAGICLTFSSSLSSIFNSSSHSLTFYILQYFHFLCTNLPSSLIASFSLERLQLRLSSHTPHVSYLQTLS